MTDGPQTPESAINLSPGSPTQVKDEIQQSQQKEGAILPQTTPKPSETTRPLEGNKEQNQISSTPTEQTQVKEKKLTNQVLVSFLEKQKYSTSENQSLPPDQQEFNRKVDELIKSSNQNPDQPVNQETFIQGLNLAYQKNLPDEISQIESLISQMKEKVNEPGTNPEEKQELNDKINLLHQIQQKKEELLKNGAEIPDEVKRQIETVFNQLKEDPELKNQLLTHLESGSFDGVMDVIVNKSLQEEAGDSEKTKQAKSRAARVIRGLKEKGPLIGGVFGILLLLMILKASNSGSGQNQMMG